ncbi:MULTISPECIES: kynureninase [unclassified Minwuia]|jgi:kynureninase|uniref:kynureninase n=1 Tax=unclassified Minwuia TaxID=2618799 RepID=UPI0024796B8B|nr:MULTISPECIES: kynureninase [unclassified Minwuia]
MDDLTQRAADLDAADPLSGWRERFTIPAGLVYLDGNSLGVLPCNVPARVADAVSRGWGEQLIRGWNAEGWMDLPRRIGDRIAGLIGAPESSVICADSTSINLAKVLQAALAMVPERQVVLSDTGNFPTDLYVAQGQLGRAGTLTTVAPEDVAAAMTPDVGVLMLTQVDYRSGRLHDMHALTARARDLGIVTIWDLAHSAGALPVDLAGAGADFAVGCGYKYLNGGPGAPAFLYVRPELQNQVNSHLTGWMGHAAPFAFDPDYRPAEGIDRFRVGTPAILSMVAMDAALDVWDDVDMQAVRAKSLALGDLFIACIDRFAGDHDLRLASPRDGDSRGSQVSWHCPDGYAVMQALIDQGVIGDFREPDVIRFGFTPLYLSFADVLKAAKTLEDILRNRTWDQPRFHARAKVT